MNMHGKKGYWHGLKAFDFCDPSYWRHGYMSRATWNYDEDNATYKIKIGLPGVEKEDIKIKATDESVRVTAERKDDSSEEKKLIYKEKFYFRRRIDPAKISATYANGLLKLELPTQEQAKAQDVPVN
ncbi:MAG: Hsp20/alpha crystallin family protein [Candidatus Hodarchaeota archaeon]